MPSSVSNHCLWEGLCDHITAPTLREVLPPGDFDILCFSPVLSLRRFYLADFSLSSKFLVCLMIICPASLYLTLHLPPLPLSVSSVSGSSFHRLFDGPSAPSWSSQFGLFPELNLSDSKLETTGYLKSSGLDSIPEEVDCPSKVGRVWEVLSVRSFRDIWFSRGVHLPL